MDIRRLLSDFATDLLAGQSAGSRNANLTPNISLESLVNRGLHVSHQSDSPVPPQQEVINKLTLVFSGGLLEPLHNGIIEISYAENAIVK